MKNKTDEQTLTHFNAKGEAHMVDVAHKIETHRVAVATGSIHLSEVGLAQLINQEVQKGDVLAVARIAAIQATKQTGYLIPLCHPVALTQVEVRFEVNAEEMKVHIWVSAATVGKTGVEMEALTGAMTGLLTIYDMLKAVDKGMQILNVHLVSKVGGKSGDWQHPLYR